MKEKALKSTYSYKFVVLLLFLSLFIKDLNSQAVLANFYSTDVLDYPFVTIFNEKEIYKYRPNIIK